MRVTAQYVKLPLVLMIFPALGRPMPRQAMGAQNELERNLGRAFAAIHNVVVLPVAINRARGAGVGITFYVGWDEPDQNTYVRLSEIISRFHGALQWSVSPEFNDRGAFITGLPEDQMKQVFKGENPQPTSFADLDNDVREFSDFVSNSLKNAAVGPTEVQRPGLSGEPFEDSVYQIYLVAVPEVFMGGPTSSRDRLLHFGLTEAEWRSLSDAEVVDRGALGTSQASLIASLRNRYQASTLSPGEVLTTLRALQGNLPRISNADLRKAVEKLIMILNYAANDNLGIVLEPSD